ncbi:hypothetical protein GQR58_005849 [Nymphon striatum]|nr:hypothetical protein GQR58_005849 [Nymphon striatum]
MLITILYARCWKQKNHIRATFNIERATTNDEATVGKTDLNYNVDFSALDLPFDRSTFLTSSPKIHLKISASSPALGQSPWATATQKSKLTFSLETEFVPTVSSSSSPVLLKSPGKETETIKKKDVNLQELSVGNYMAKN